MLSRRVLVLATMAVLALTAVPALSATYAEPDGNTHPYVVMLTFYYDAEGAPDTAPLPDADGDGVPEYPSDYQWRCTGTLIRPDTVLTAGHCTAGVPTGPDGGPLTSGTVPMTLARVFINYESEDVHPALAEGAVAGTDFVDGTPIPHPSYDDAWPEFPQTYDVAVIKLDAPITDDNEWGIDLDSLPTLVEPGTLEGYTQAQLKHDLVFETVGYGLQWTRGPWRYDGDWVRHTAWSTYVNSKSANNADRYGDYNIQTSNNKGHTKGGSCFGDSGGPVFLHERDAIAGDHTGEHRHEIVAVVSFGMSPNCTGVDFSYRVDQDAVQDFIENPSAHSTD